MASICNTPYCKEYSTKIPNDLIKHVNFILLSDDPAIANRPVSFPDFDHQSTNILGMDHLMSCSIRLQCQFQMKNKKNKAFMPLVIQSLYEAAAKYFFIKMRLPNAY